MGVAVARGVTEKRSTIGPCRRPVRLACRYPLELAAARALSHSLDEIAAQVTSDPSRLSRVGRGHQDHRATVRAAVEWSHQLLSPREQLAHRRLSVLPRAFTAGLAAAVVGATGQDELGDVDDLLAQLVHRSLLSSEGSSRTCTSHQDCAAAHATKS